MNRRDPNKRTPVSIHSIFVLVAVLLAGLGSATDAWCQTQPASQNPSPMEENVRAHVRLPDSTAAGQALALDVGLARPIEVFVPEVIDPWSGFDLLLHFHGSAFIGRHAVAAMDAAMVAVNVHLGAGSSAYEVPFSEEGRFRDLLSAVSDTLSALGVTLPPDRPDRRILLSAFSAGYGAIRAILGTDGALVDGVLLLDGLHTDYVPERRVLFEGGVLGTEKLDPFVRFARLSVAGHKRMLITHSEIFPGTFASTTETTDYLIEKLGLRRRAVLEWGPGGMQMLSRVDAGQLTVLGFAGNTAPDHVDHFHGMPEFLGQMLDEDD